MRPEDNLRQDHGRIMKLFAAWQKILEDLDHADQAMHEALAKCIDFVEVFVDRCHHGKEDGILFPAMASSKNFETTSLIQDLRSEHQTGRSLIKAIKLECKAFLGRFRMPSQCWNFSIVRNYYPNQEYPRIGKFKYTKTIRNLNLL